MSEGKESHWIPLADLMTVLMVIFLFLSILFIKRVKDQTQGISSSVKELNQARQNLLSDINKEFANNLDAQSMADWHAVLDTTNLSVKFLDEQILFDQSKDELKPEFKRILNEFIPKFLAITLKDKYLGMIGEIRVEGHTSPEGSYIFNLNLSQSRTTNVISFLRNTPYYANLKKQQKAELDYLLTANGLSSGRTVNRKNELTYFSDDKTIDWKKSRRVEFRIVMNSDKILKNNR